MRSISPYALALLVGVTALVAAMPSARAVPGDPAGAASASSAAPQTSATGRALPSPIDATNTCAACHSTLTDAKLRAPAKEFSSSVHRDDRIGCVGCHGGDARDPTAGAHSKAMGFRPHPTSAEVPGICGGCHSDAGFMRRLNGRLGVGQAALYGLSLHGRLNAAGDPMAPNCATCHGKHDILPPASPKAPVNRANVAKLCSGCHADAKLMSKYDIATDQFSKWQKSVHGEAFAKGNPNAPTCTGCHGAHASAPPDASSVAHACGRCHQDEMGFFEQSVHSQGFRKRGIAQCVACHSNHDVAPASPQLVGTTSEAACMKCHSNDEKPRKVADDIAALLRGARDRAAEARAAVARAHDLGLHVPGAAYSLQQVTTAELKVRGVVHTLDPARVETSVSEINSAVDATLKQVADAEKVRSLERRDYFIALALASLLFVTLALKALELERRRRQVKP
ncbi:MAG TPA: cytochrome c3 family protein [Polyangiaceae bacterium]